MTGIRRTDIDSTRDLNRAMTEIETLAASKYISLTTIKRDGTPVSTPVWLVRDSDALRVITQLDSGKVKRIRNVGDVQVAPCDARGRLKGEPVAARAELEDPADTAMTRKLIIRRYGLLGRMMLRGSADKRVGIRITLTPPA